MSDSDEEVPLAARRQAVQHKPPPSAAAKIKVEPQKSQVSAVRVKHEVLEDDIPLITKKAPIKKEAPGKAAPPSRSKVQMISEPPKPTKSGRSKSANVKKEDDKVKREKKEFDMPAQTRETPPETDPLRKFYTSLLSQLPGSEMARKWCAQHGLLEREEAERWVEESKSKKSGVVLKSPAKPAPSRASSLNNGASKPRAPTKPSSTQPLSRPAIKSEPNGKSSSASTKRTLDDSEDERPLAKKLKPPPRSVVAKSKPVIDDDDSEDEPLVMKKTSRSAPPVARNGSAASAPKPAPSKPAVKPPPPPPPPQPKVAPKIEQDDSSDEDMPLVQRRHHAVATR